MKVIRSEVVLLLACLCVQIAQGANHSSSSANADKAGVGTVATSLPEAEHVDGVKAEETVQTHSDKVVFIKLHKVGSGTFSSILRRRCDERGLRCSGVPTDTYRLSTVRVEGLQEMAAEHPGEFDVWWNHVVFHPQTFDALVPGNIKTAFFRNPLDRVASSFKFAVSRNGVASAMQPLEALQTGTWNLGLCGPPDAWTDKMSSCCGPLAGLSMSAQIPLENFKDLDFVMLLESFDLSLLMFRRLVGWSMSDMLYLKLHDLSSEPSPDEKKVGIAVKALFSGGENRITTEVGQAFYKNCVGGKEAKLYDMAKQKFQEQWDSLPAAEQKEIQEEELPAFQEALESLSICCNEHKHDPYCLAMSENSEAWFARHGSGPTVESLPYPLVANSIPSILSQTPPTSQTQTKDEALAAIDQSSCKSLAMQKLSEMRARQ